MRHYEVMVILDPNLEERTIAPSLDTFLNVVKKDGGTVDKVDIWGQRRLAYEIDKNAEGIYAVIDVQAEPAVGARTRPSAQPQRVGAADQGPAAGRAVGSHGRRHRHHRGRQPDRRPRAALHPVRRRRRVLHHRVHPAHVRPQHQRVEGRRRAVPALLHLASGRRERRRVAAHAACASSSQGRLKQRSFETREGEKRTVIELEVDEVGPSLRYATAKVNRTQRGSSAAAVSAPSGVRRRRRARRPTIRGVPPPPPALAARDSPTSRRSNASDRYQNL